LHARSFQPQSDRRGHRRPARPLHASQRLRFRERNRRYDRLPIQMKTALALVLALVPLVVAAQEPAANPAAHYFQNLALVDQNGKTVDLYNDVMKGHTVVINSFFASCTASCTVMAGNYGHLQQRFPDLRLVSITVDP